MLQQTTNMHILKVAMSVWPKAGVHQIRTNRYMIKSTLKDCQVLSLGDSVFLRVVSSDEMANPEGTHYCHGR